MTVICASCGIDEPHRGHYAGCTSPLAGTGDSVPVYPHCIHNREEHDMAYVVKYTETDDEIMSDLRSMATEIERGNLTAPGEGHSPLVRALMYIERGTGWDAWTTSYLYTGLSVPFAGHCADIESATRFATEDAAIEMAEGHACEQDTYEVIEVA